jgi:hypothetical protein
VEEKAKGGLSSRNLAELDFLGRCGDENLLLAAFASLKTSEMTRVGIGDFDLFLGFVDPSPATLSDTLRASGLADSVASFAEKGDGLEHTLCSLRLCSSEWKENSIVSGLPWLLGL